LGKFISFFGINLPKSGIPPLAIFKKKFSLGREFQFRNLIPNFTVLALKKMWAYSLRNRDKSHFFV